MVCGLMGTWRKWSPERDDRLFGLWAEGRTVAEIAAELETTKPAVRARVERLRQDDASRLPYRDPIEWTAATIRRVDEMARAHRTIQQIAEAVGRSPSATAQLMQRYGITTGNKVRWSPDERKTLRRLRRVGMPMHVIAERMGRSLQSVKFQVWWLRHREGA